LLEGKLEALSIGLFGDRVHVVTQDAVNTRARAEQLIREAGLPLDEVRLAGASLEDVFVSVLAQQPESGDD
jgi:ABC-2 type transport system ATP-binding protein